ncbi:MAG: hypothetical protein IKK17_03550, partial [Oscillospiraceae bacterium]|nr:hypothetical protein [Oscillospiraceae bacterium]
SIMLELIPDFERLGILTRKDSGEIALDIPALTFDEARLYHVLLESYEGVVKLYAVSADGRQVGLLEDLWEVTALLKEYPTGSIRITHTYSHPDAADGLRYVRAALREINGETVDF